VSGGLLASAMSASLLPFEESLALIPVTKEKARGHTASTEGDSVTFRGVIVEADVFRQMIAPGGVISATQPVLAVGVPVVDSEGEDLEITKDDLVVNVAGVRYKVIKRVDESDRFGVLLFSLTEAR